MKINHNGDYVLVVCPNPSVDIYAWVNEFTFDATNRIIKEERYPGGKGVHVAMALAELDIEVVLLGLWGSVTGQWIKTECNKYYPNIRCIGPNIDGWSRSCYTFKSSGKLDDTELLGTGPDITGEDYDLFLNYLDDHLADAKAMVLSGSWPKGSPEAGYSQMIIKANRSVVPSFLDCTGIQLQNAVKEVPYCIHLNRHEVTTFTGTNNFESALNEISKVCQLAAITDGANGLSYFNGSETLHSLAKITKVYSSIGSGDCLLAGIIAGHINQNTDQEIANLGAACGAANCLRPELGMLRKSDVENLLENL